MDASEPAGAPDPSGPPAPPAPPGIPDALEPLDDAALDALADAWRAAERAVRAAMAPYEERLTAVRAGLGRIATERRRRERQRHIRSRQAVRTEVRQGSAPSLEQVLSAAEPLLPDASALGDLQVLLDTGGEVALGYPGTRTPVLPMTDGSTVRSVMDLGEARRLFQEGWEVGVPARPGVRVHTPGTRLERLLEVGRCFVRLRPTDP